jgi:hypothetical protein
VRDTPPSAQDYSRYRTSGIPKETRIPVTGEKLGISRAREATNTKEPVSEKKTQVSTQREIKIERRPACKTVSSNKAISSLLRQNSIDLVGKTLRTNDNQDLGKIESVENEVIIIKRVLLTFVDLHYYYIPFAEVQDWDGKVVLLKISRDQVEKQYSSHDPPRREKGNVKDSS